jgi:hypothetical protein
MRTNNKNFNHEKKVTWIINSFFISGTLVSLVMVFHYLSYIQTDFKFSPKVLTEDWFVYTILFFISGVLFACGLMLRVELKTGVIKWMLLTFISPYFVELNMQFPFFHGSDDSQFKMVNSLRQKGIDAHRDIGGAKFIYSRGLKTVDGRIFPLGGISNKQTVMENNLPAGFPGFRPVILTDEHGFNNKRGLYVKDDVDIVITGECTLEYAGEKYPVEENIGEQLRQLNYKTINLAKAGSSFLLFLASLKEYAEPLRPKVVIFGYGGDNIDERMETFPLSPRPSSESDFADNFFSKYLLEDNFTQNLISRQTEIDNALKDFLYQHWEKLEIIKEKEIQKVLNREDKQQRLKEKIFSWLKLTKLRNNFRFRSPNQKDYHFNHPPSKIFRQVITEMKRLVSSWGGRLYAMKIPGPGKYQGNHIIKYEGPGSAEKIYTELEVGFMDMGKEVFDVHPDPLSLFPQRNDQHPNGKGKKLMARAIVKRLQADGFMPRKY